MMIFQNHKKRTMENQKRKKRNNVCIIIVITIIIIIIITFALNQQIQWIYSIINMTIYYAKKCHQNKFQIFILCTLMWRNVHAWKDITEIKNNKKYKIKLILIIFHKAYLSTIIWTCSFFSLYSDFLAIKFNFLSYYRSTTMLNSNDDDDDDDNLNKATKTTTSTPKIYPKIAMSKTSSNGIKMKIKTNCCFILIFSFFLHTYAYIHL